jgi:hypothetical protein
MMLSVVYALLASVVSTFRSREALRLENMALRHQVAVYQRTVCPRIQPTDRLFWAWLARLWAGWQRALASCNPVRSSHGNASNFASTGGT